jgi:hypothetical protein
LSPFGHSNIRRREIDIRSFIRREPKSYEWELYDTGVKAEQSESQSIDKLTPT